ncbi:MAG: hypothetical protein ACK5JD_15925 [Mangrovibacterium sp.]
MRAKIFYTTFFIFIALQVFSQNKEITVELLGDEFSYNLLKTSDELYIGDNPSKYLISKSPLSFFKGYKSAYRNDSLITIIGNPFPSPPYGAFGHSEKEYVALWILLNSELFLCEIYFPFIFKDNKEIYPPIEKFTGKYFLHNNIPNNEGLKRIYGLMPATWFTDTLYVKKANPELEPMLPIEWKKEHYLRMIFDKGQLISTEIIANKTWVYTATRSLSGFAEGWKN